MAFSIKFQLPVLQKLFTAVKDFYSCNYWRYDPLNNGSEYKDIQHNYKAATLTTLSTYGPCWLRITLNMLTFIMLTNVMLSVIARFLTSVIVIVRCFHQ
jgi:hypothetical protein